MFRGFRSLLSHSRVPIRLASVPHDSIYRVRFIPRPRGAGSSHVFWRSMLYGALLVAGYHTVLVLVEDQPVFVPLWFAQPEPLRDFTQADPEPAIFQKFSRDPRRQREAGDVLKDRVCAILNDAFRQKLGGNVRALGGMLAYHSPRGPPQEYVQRGIRISSVEDDFQFSSDDPPTGTTLILNNLRFESATRRLDGRQTLRVQNITQPAWVFRSLLASIRGTYMLLTSAPPTVHPTVTDAVDFGIGLSSWIMDDFKRNLAQNRKGLPPPRGHIVIDGLLQVTSNNLKLGIDVTASFNPENPKQMIIMQIRVRFAERNVQPQQNKMLPADQLRGRNQASLAPGVLAALKQDAKATAERIAKDTKGPQEGDGEDKKGSSPRADNAEERKMLERGIEQGAKEEPEVPPANQTREREIQRKRRKISTDDPPARTEEESAPRPPPPPSSPPAGPATPPAGKA